MLTAKEQKKRAKQFIDITKDWKEEEQYKHKFWTSFLALIFGETDINYLVFEKPVFDVASNSTKFIDVYIPSTKVIIEQKSWHEDLEKAWGQARNYSNNLPANERANWIIVSDFERIIVYDMTTSKFPSKTFYTRDLERDYASFNFLVDSTVVDLPDTSFDVSKRAGEIIAEIYNAVYDKYPVEIDEETKLQNLNKFCVRMVFCFYAEDAGLFDQKDQFYNYMRQFEAKDWCVRLTQLFKILNTPKNATERLYLDDDLRAFPYVNGGLFDGDIQLPQFTSETVDLILKTAAGNFDWSQISPTIFGAMFESTLNPETRRKGGMHYTSIENIHRVIDPLFLDDLKARLEEIKGFSVSQRTRALREYQDYLASLKFLDPACGSGNFLTEAYVCIRKLENEALEILLQDQMAFNDYAVKVSIKQFYGIEINDFAVSVAMTALWIAESQMFEESQKILHGNKDFLPLTTNTNIHEGNALDIKWEDVANKNEINYIMGNPPFVGMKEQSDLQKSELLKVTKLKKLKQLDYVVGWFFKAKDFIKDTSIKCAFVASNSITQGEQALTIWEPLFAEGIIINFCYKTFVWDSEANLKAHVHCVIVGFSYIDNIDKRIFDNNSIINCEHINQYLENENNMFVLKSGKPICNVHEMTKGAQLIDNGNFVIESEEEYLKIIKREPDIAPYIKQYWNARDLLNNGETKYAFYLENCPPNILHKSLEIQKRVNAVYEFRVNNKKASTKALADRPSHYFQSQAPTGKSLVIPVVSSQRRKYIPICFMSEGMVYTNAVFYIDNADLYDLGILISNVHMSWMRKLCGRMKSDYRYSNTIVYNTFPWPSPSIEQKDKIIETSQGILDSRALYSDCSLSDLYDPLTMPIELRNAHEENDKAVWEAYGKAWEFGNEAECVAYLMKLYEQKVQEISK